jgi:hypothetical protein
MKQAPKWHVYKAERESADARARTVDAWLKRPPPWRRPPTDREAEGVAPVVDRAPPGSADRETRRAEKFIDVGGAVLRDRVNMALLLRRPLLVSGPPGSGKSSLAYSIAWRLGLGRPLRWEINSRTTLQEGLYAYDAVGHLHAARGAEAAGRDVPIGDFVTLGPLGTALLAGAVPRVLLIDELDKASYDLPNDLLHVFEEGAFVVHELAKDAGAHVHGWDDAVEDPPWPVPGGRVIVHHHPVVIATTNGEREFPDAFLRRCVRLDMQRPDDKELAAIVAGWFDDDKESAAQLKQIKNACKGQSTDVLLQALFLTARHGAETDSVADALKRAVSND